MRVARWSVRVKRWRRRWSGLSAGERHVLEELHRLGALSHADRCQPRDLDYHVHGPALRSLIRRGIIRQAEPERFCIDEQGLDAYFGRRRSRGLAFSIAAVHLAVAITGLALVHLLCASDSCVIQRAVFDPAEMSGQVFFGALLTTGIVLYALMVTAHAFGLVGADPGRRVTGVAALSVAVAVLLAVDAHSGATTRSSAAGAAHESFWGVVYTLLMERRAVSLLALVTLAAVVVAVYHGVRALLTVQYEGAGIQIRLPGQTVYYLPLYPQISWQNTGIALKAGQRVSIEISGYVSPGALGDLTKLEQHMKAYVESVLARHEGKATTDPEDPFESIWDYTGPAGYPESWYADGRQPPFLRDHPIYKKPYFYRIDPDLTVTGLPHNVVLGKIVAPGEPAPEEARPRLGKHGYDYSNPDHQSQLLYLSSRRYPIDFEVPKSGELWAVINDVDVARWDNTGMFFLKVTRHAWL